MKVNPEFSAEHGISSSRGFKPGEISFYNPMQTIKSPEQLAAKNMFVHRNVMEATWGEGAHDRYLQAMRTQIITTIPGVPVKGPRG